MNHIYTNFSVFKLGHGILKFANGYSSGLYMCFVNVGSVHGSKSQSLQQRELFYLTVNTFPEAVETPLCRVFNTSTSTISKIGVISIIHALRLVRRLRQLDLSWSERREEERAAFVTLLTVYKKVCNK